MTVHEGAPCLDGVRDCLEGVVPGILATSDRNGIPNVTFVSQVDYVDPGHVGISFQFFNKTRENILANRRCTVLVTHPDTGCAYRLSLEYLRTETEGPLFERMKAKLAGIASYTGMAGIFRLLGSDVYRVTSIAEVAGMVPLPAAPARPLLGALRGAVERMGRCDDLGVLFDETLRALDEALGIEHALLLMADGARARLYTVASHGYPASGVGSEVLFGEGAIGVAAEQRVPIRIAHMTTEYAYGQAMRAAALEAGLHARAGIPFPGLARPHSQLAVPILDGERCLGVLCVESAHDRRFGHAEEDAVAVVASQLALGIRLLGERAEEPAEEADARRPEPAGGDPIRVRHYAENDSVFLDDDYLIKGVAGAVFWKLVRDHAGGRRSEFTNRELRLDPSLRLPEIADNLETRLILLARRLSERCTALSIEKTGRGRFRLCVRRPLDLVDVPA